MMSKIQSESLVGIDIISISSEENDDVKQDVK